jgi:hypothetical protein
MEGLFGFSGRDVTDGAEKASVIEPVDPPEGLPFDGIDGFSRRAAVDNFGLEQTDDRLCEGVIVRISHRSDGRLDASVNEPFGVAQRQVLRPAVRMRDQFRVMARTALVQGLLESIEDELGLPGPRDPPANDPVGEGVDDEGWRGPWPRWGRVSPGTTRSPARC